MAFTKSHTLQSGATVTKFRVQSYRIDYPAREVSAHVAAYVGDSTTALLPIFAKLRITGDRFDEVLGKAKLKNAGKDINAILYEALVSDPVVCDAGPDFFADAEPS